MQLTKDQRVFVIKTWISTGSIKQVQESFAHSFPDRISPSKNAIWENVRKYQQEKTSLILVFIYSNPCPNILLVAHINNDTETIPFEEIK